MKSIIEKTLDTGKKIALTAIITYGAIRVLEDEEEKTTRIKEVQKTKRKKSKYKNKRKFKVKKLKYKNKQKTKVKKSKFKNKMKAKNLSSNSRASSINREDLYSILYT